MKQLQAMIVALPGSWVKILQYYIEEYPSIKVEHVATGGLSAIERTKGTQIDLIVIDSSIPSEDVAVLIRSVKKMQSDICIIAIVDTTKEAHKIRRAGADYTITACNFDQQISEALNEISQRFLENDAMIEKINPSNKQNFSPIEKE